MDDTKLGDIIEEVSRRLSTIADTEHLGFYAGDMPQLQSTAFGRPVQDSVDGELGYERFSLELPIGLRTVDQGGSHIHMTRLISLYAAVKRVVHGDNADDFTLGGRAELVEEAGFTTETGFDMASLEADGVLTLRIQYETERGNPLKPD